MDKSEIKPEIALSLVELVERGVTICCHARHNWTQKEAAKAWEAWEKDAQAVLAEGKLRTYLVLDEETGEYVGEYNREEVANAAAERNTRETAHDSSVWVGSRESAENTGYYVEAK